MDHVDERIKKLPPWARGIFEDFVKKLQDREQNMMVCMLEASRADLRGTMTNITREQEDLRGTPLPPLSTKDHYLDDPRQASLAQRGVSPEKLQRYLQRKLEERAPRGDSRATSRATSRSSLSSTSIHFDSRPSTSSSLRADSSLSRASTSSSGASSSRTSLPVGRSSKASGKVSPRLEKPPPAPAAAPAKSSLKVDRPAPAEGRRSPSVGRRKSPAPLNRVASRDMILPGQTPEPADEATLRKESAALIAAAEEVEARNETERQRQWEKVQKAKERKKLRQQQQANLAAEMFSLAQQVAAAQSKDQELHGQKIKERLEEMKRRKENPQQE